MSLQEKSQNFLGLTDFESESKSSKMSLTATMLEHRDMKNLNIKAYEYRNQLIVASEFVKSKVGSASIAIVLGSGLGGFSDGLKNVSEISYKDVPFLPTPTVKGHSGKIIMGDVVDKDDPKHKRRVMCFAGRLHAYEVNVFFCFFFLFLLLLCVVYPCAIVLSLFFSSCCFVCFVLFCCLCFAVVFDVCNYMC